MIYRNNTEIKLVQGTFKTMQPVQDIKSNKIYVHKINRKSETNM